MDVRGRPVNFHDKARFLVEIPGFTYAGFQSCSDIGVAFAVKSYPDGASPTPFKKAGKEEYANITLEQGVSENDDILRWVEEVRAAVRAYGVLPEDYKRTVNIVQIDETGTRVRETVLYNAFPAADVVGAWDATDKEGFVMNSLELAFDDFDVFR